MVHENSSACKPRSQTRPLYYTTENTFQETGFTYRFIRDEAIRLGVKIHKFGKGKRRWGIDVAEFHAKRDAEDARVAALEPTREAEQDPTDRVLAQLGLVRK